MTAGERARSLAFWTLDRLRGGRVRSHMRDFALLDRDPALAVERRAEQLQRLLSHARGTTAHYAQFSGGGGLGDFPVLQKRVIREKHRDFLSSAYHPDSLVSTTTSGSYGTPFTFRLTREKKSRQQAEVIHYARWLGYEVGSRHGYVRVTKVKGPLRLWLQNEVLIDPTHITEEWLERQRQALRSERIKFVVAYPSALAAIAAYCRACGDSPDDYSLQGVVATAEPLYDETRRAIEGAFGCSVLSRYSTEELGVLAQECPLGKQHHLNQATFVFELLEAHEDRPVPAGELGRVIVTDLWSHAMPLIRYDLGDIATMAEECACGWKGPVLTRIEGRTVETLYGTDGSRISAFAINGAMRDLEGVIQFQFVQHDLDRYTVRLCTLPSFAGEEVVKRRLLALLGPEVCLSVEYVDEIPALRSGKRPYIVTEVRPPARATSS